MVALNAVNGYTVFMKDGWHPDVTRRVDGPGSIWMSFRDARDCPAHVYRYAVLHCADAKHWSLTVEYRGRHPQGISHGVVPVESVDDLITVLAQCGVVSHPYATSLKDALNQAGAQP